MTVSENRIDAAQGYTAVQIGLHWVIALFVFAQLIFGESMTEFVEAAEDGQPVSALNANLASMHYYFGIVILALVAIRLILRIRIGVPPPPVSNGALETAGRIVHLLFYLLLFMVPIMGLLGYYFGDPYGEIHALAKPVFIVLIALHVAASLFHQFWRNDGLLGVVARARLVRPHGAGDA